MTMTIILTILLAVSLVNADVYMHAPRGSNNRLNERSANRKQGNRAFDSQVKYFFQNFLSDKALVSSISFYWLIMWLSPAMLFTFFLFFFFLNTDIFRYSSIFFIFLRYLFTYGTSDV